jgi:hypothetical protein
VNDDLIFGDETDVRVPSDRSELFYGSVDEFVRKNLRFKYRRRIGKQGRGDYSWSSRWWQNEEAVSRLDALWRAWEACRLDSGTGMSDWWLHHCDPQMAVLLSKEGPFAASDEASGADDPLPYERPPSGLFPPDRQPALPGEPSDSPADRTGRPGRSWSPLQ